MRASGRGRGRARVAVFDTHCHLLGTHGRRVWRVDAGEAQLEDRAILLEQLAQAADRVRRLHVVVLLALEPCDERAADVRLVGLRVRVRLRLRVRVRVWVSG